ncbi:glutamate receptor ionotropic, kainate 2-like [Mytilus californianus]|uniref:glutamate receptor ionotropic, kainate 2-like n=1 Tax=Mytilus californianus TaxID=6549 RepID=UPI0022482A66|nr:glutamate receptor ionotropic, kainate 2-like [Mytilus californianus]
MRLKILVFFSLCTVFSVKSFSTYLNAAIVGYKDRTNFENYKTIAEKLENDSSVHFCKLNLTEAAYDKTDGPHVYQSLTSARSLFDDDHMTIAIGPYIDVFTSMQYVIRKQVHLVTESAEKPEPSDRTFPILPDATSMSTAIAQIVEKLNWKKVAFLSQGDFAPVLSLSQKNIFVFPTQLPVNITSKEDPDLRQTLTTLRINHMEKFILHSMDRDVVKNVIFAAEDLHLLHHSRKWFLTYLDFEDIFEKDFPTSATLFGLQMLDPTRLTAGIPGEYFKERSRFEVAVLVDTVNMLRHFLTRGTDCYAQPERDRFITKGNILDKMQEQENQFHGALGAYHWILKPETQLRIKSNFNMSITRLNGKVEQIGLCTFSDSGLILRVDRQMDRTVDHKLHEVLQNKTFTVITRLDPPFVQRGHGDRYEGFCVDILEEVSSIMNFNYTIKLADNGVNDWDKIINQVVKGDGDIIIGSLDVKSSREEQISFSTTIMDSTVSILLQKPPATPTFFQFLGPFTSHLWFTILGVFFVVGGALYLMGRYDTTQRESDQQFDLKESLWYSLNVLLQGGTEYAPQTTSMRTIVAIYWFCTLIITTAYTANLAAFLTLKNIDNRVKTVDALVTQKKISYGVLKGSDLEKFFAKSDNDLYKRMWIHMKLNEVDIMPDKREDARKMVQGENDKYVFLDDSVMNDHYAMEHCTTLESIHQGFGDKQYSFGFPRGAPYRDDINRALLMLQENGHLDILKAKWWRSNCTQAEVEKSQIKSSSELEIENMFGVFLILLGSIVLAIIVEVSKRVRLEIEKRYYKHKVNKEIT